MNRLSIDEIIQHCDRKLSNKCQSEILKCEHEAVKFYLQELQHYRDLEEQGRLVEVTRCKDCKFMSESILKTSHVVYCDIQRKPVVRDGYCSSGKSRLAELENNK